MAKGASAELWTFSLAVYDVPGAAPACLALQDRHGVDVNLLFYCLWAGARGRPLSRAELKSLTAVVARWREEVILPLRSVRRNLKRELDDDAQDLRGRVLDLEIEAERLEQVRLLAALVPAPDLPDPRIAAANLRTYLAALKIDLGEDDIADLATLMTSAFPDLPPLLAVWFLLP